MSLTAHVTTVHPRTDVRIRVKECGALDASGLCDLCLVVADSLGPEVSGALKIRDVGRPPGGRFGRALIGSVRVLREVRALRPSVVHFHDPELLPACLLLASTGHTVVYDVHEDMPTQIMSKSWLPAWLRRPVARAVSGLERLAGHAFSAVVAATPAIAGRFPPEKTVLVRNYPLLREFSGSGVPYADRSPDFAYIGVIATIRGARTMIDAAAQLRPGARLLIAGNYSPPALRAELAVMPGWGAVVEQGWLDRAEIEALLGRVRAGLVVLQPTPNYIDSLPVKLFEYMAAGIPVVASDFPLWRTIVEDAGCGLLVDPSDPAAVADAMKRLLDDPEEAALMGARGKEAVRDRYSFAEEAERLVELYGRLLGTGR